MGRILENKNKEEPNFEEALAEIDSIVSKLEGGQLTLDESLVMFQRGMELMRFCGEKLDAAEKKLKIIIEGAEGEFKVEDGNEV
ncbi:MAG: exodeoxyribonuclease VII small subunit [candidate division Zixibacteria bacterium]|nr:exodeoxyribonuclease VII small subunit [Candidatus Tariuqbacter arcticus]